MVDPKNTTFMLKKIINWKIVFRKILKNFWIMIQINITKN